MSQLDSRPRIVPSWPKSPRKAIVVLFEDAAAGVVLRALVLCSSRELRNSFQTPLRKLFFEVLREDLLSSGACPGLAAESFSEDLD